MTTLKREIKNNNHKVKRKHIFFGLLILVFSIALILINSFLPAYTEACAYVFSFTALFLGFIKWLPRLNTWFEHMVL
jgi:hypothetical protein